MTVTPHGWHIPGSDLPENYNPELLAVQCGGVKSCAVCEDAMVAWNLKEGRKILQHSREKSSLIKTYQTKKNTCKAVQYLETNEAFKEVSEFAAYYGGAFEVTFDSGYLTHSARIILPEVNDKLTPISMNPTQWAVCIDNEFFVYDDKVFRDIWEVAPEERQSNLVDHAKRELEIIGEDPEVVDAYLQIVRIFADMGHSGVSAAFSIPVIEHLLSFKPLSELTDDPEDWIHHGEDIWGEKGGIYQSRRNGQAFSKDGGKTYYLLSDNSNSRFQTKIYTSKGHKK